jgi:hypothetical protein
VVSQGTGRLSHRQNGNPRRKSPWIQTPDCVANQFRGGIIANQSGINDQVVEQRVVDIGDE